MNGLKHYTIQSTESFRTFDILVHGFDTPSFPFPLDFFVKIAENTTANYFKIKCAPSNISVFLNTNDK